MEANCKKENHKELDNLKVKVLSSLLHQSLYTLNILIQLEDVQQAYMMDKIWLEEKYEDLLGHYQSERDTERKHYEVSYNSCTNNSSIIM